MDKKITGIIKKKNTLQGSVNILSATSGVPKIVYANVTGVNGNLFENSFRVTLDMTYAEISEEIAAGNFVIIKDSLSYVPLLGDSPSGAFVPLVAVLENSVCFACSFYFYEPANKTETLTYFVGTDHGTDYVNVQVYPAVSFD